MFDVIFWTIVVVVSGCFVIKFMKEVLDDWSPWDF